MFKSSNLTVALIFAAVAVAVSVVFYFLDKRLDGKARTATAWISLILYALIPVCVFLLGGGMGDAAISLGAGAVSQLIFMTAKSIKNKGSEDGEGEK